MIRFSLRLKRNCPLRSSFKEIQEKIHPSFVRFLVRVCLEHRNGEMSITKMGGRWLGGGGSCWGTPVGLLVTGSCK